MPWMRLQELPSSCLPPWQERTSSSASYTRRCQRPEPHTLGQGPVEGRAGQEHGAERGTRAAMALPGKGCSLPSGVLQAPSASTARWGSLGTVAARARGRWAESLAHCRAPGLSAAQKRGAWNKCWALPTSLTTCSWASPPPLTAWGWRPQPVSQYEGTRGISLPQSWHRAWRGPRGSAETQTESSASCWKAPGGSGSGAHPSPHHSCHE